MAWRRGGPLLNGLKQGICTTQDDNSWTPNGTAIAILGRFFRSGELVRDFWSKQLRAWVRAARADLFSDVTEQAKDLLPLTVCQDAKSMRTPFCDVGALRHVHEVA